MTSPKHTPHHKWSGPSSQEDDDGPQCGCGLHAGCPSAAVRKGGLWAGPGQLRRATEHTEILRETLCRDSEWQRETASYVDISACVLQAGIINPWSLKKIKIVNGLLVN